MRCSVRASGPSSPRLRLAPRGMRPTTAPGEVARRASVVIAGIELIGLGIFGIELLSERLIGTGSHQLLVIQVTLAGSSPSESRLDWMLGLGVTVLGILEGRRWLARTIAGDVHHACFQHPEGMAAISPGSRSNRGLRKRFQSLDPGGVAARRPQTIAATPPGSRGSLMLGNPGCAARTGANGCHPSGMRISGSTCLLAPGKEVRSVHPGGMTAISPVVSAMPPPDRVRVYWPLGKRSALFIPEG